MKTTLIALAAVIGLAGMAAADPIEGRWRTAPDDNGNTGIINVVQCGSNYCGTLTEAFDGNGATMASENVGRQIIWDTAPRGGGEYRGRLYSPDRDSTYKSRLYLNGDTMSVCGRLLGIERCGGDWTRVN